MTREQPNPVTASGARASCYVCGLKEGGPDGKGDAAELRPYGINMAWICFLCMINDPGRKREAKRQYAAQLESCKFAAVIGEQTGPRPLKRQDD